MYLLQEEFDKDLIPIEESFKPLVLKCKELGRAMRIGTNHGSLSARVLSYYGDTPRGMVESAVEFANICRCVVGHSLMSYRHSQLDPSLLRTRIVVFLNARVPVSPCAMHFSTSSLLNPLLHRV